LLPSNNQHSNSLSSITFQTESCKL